MATFTRVQSKGVSQGGGASISATLTSGVTTGNLLVACLASDSQPQTWSVSPGTWSTAINFLDSTNGHQLGIFYILVTAGLSGTTSFTFSTTVSSNSLFVALAEWNSSTGWLDSPLDKTSSTAASASGTTVSTGTTATTSQASELAIACTTYPAAAVTESALTSGWTFGIEQSIGGDIVERELYASLTTAVAASASYTLASGKTQRSGCIATFMPSSGGIVSSGAVNIGSAASGLSVIATVILPSGIVSMGSAVSGLQATATTVLFSGIVAVGSQASGLQGTGLRLLLSGIVDVGSAQSGLSAQVAVIHSSGVVSVGSQPSGLQITTTVLSSGVVQVGSQSSGLQATATVLIPSGPVTIGSAPASGLLLIIGDVTLRYDDVQTYYAAIRAVPTLVARIAFMAKVYFPPAQILDESMVPGEIDILLNGETWSQLHELKTINDVNNFIATYS